MGLSTQAKDWLTKHGLDGFIRVTEAPPHMEPEKIATTIDMEGIFEVTMQAVI